MAVLVSASSLNNRFTQFFLVAIALFALLWFLAPPDIRIPAGIPVPHITISKDPPSHRVLDHPIDHLIRNATRDLERLVSRETHSVHDAAEIYRLRRGRQPPPGFDLWYEFAQNHSAVIVEDFWDRIYEDLNPFWGIPAKQIREQANTFLHRISVRRGKATHRTDGQDRPWMVLWTDLVASVSPWLPDLDMAINVMDESRMVTPWEEIDSYMRRGEDGRRIVPAEELKDKFQSLKSLDKHAPDKFLPEWTTNAPYWSMAVAGCPPDSPARLVELETDFSTFPPVTGAYPKGSYKGYVSNFTLASSPCDNPDLRGLHGTFVEPISMSTTKDFFPMFGGSKLAVNNEILLPAAMYLTDDPFYSGGSEHGTSWEQKQNRMIWRGAASGGRNKKENWTRFQRHRFVAMMNSSLVFQAEKGIDPPPNFVIPNSSYYNLSTRKKKSQPGDMSRWVGTWSDTAVVHLLCFPDQPVGFKKYCPYTDPYFSVPKTVGMKEQYNYKYLPDIDGNSFSGRYRGFLGSTSLPIKATIYQEWHDSRLIPWKHFVPMDNTFADIYGIMEYFVGNSYAGIEGHDDVAKNIALGGKLWTEQVLRREDMQIYTFRLLLEYARLCDDDREIMGWREKT